MPSNRSRRLAAAGAAALATAGVLVVVASSSATAAPSTGVLVNEVYGGGGNGGSTFRNDFIELRNVGTTDVALDGWTVQYTSGAGAGTWATTPLTGTIGAGTTYLVGEAAGSGGTTDLPPTQASGTLALSATSGTIALVHSTAALTCTATTCATAANIVDLVGYGTAAVHEGAPVTGADNTHSVSRTGTTDTDHNDADFTAITPPTPTGVTTGGGDPTAPGPLRIHDIQGTTGTSPQRNNTVARVPGIVTGLRTAGSNGFWIQDPTPDANPATSEGVFVYTGSTAPTVAVGDSVLVSGKVTEFFPSSDASVLSETEIGSPTVTVVSSDNAVPAPIVLGPNTVPNTYAPNLAHGDLETAAIVPTRSALDFYESIEGMRVEVDDAPVVGPSNTFGEQYVTTKPGTLRTFRGGTYLPGEDATPAGRLELVAAVGKAPKVSVGDTFAGASIGAITYSNFGGYVLTATTVGAVVKGNLAPTVAKAATRKQLSIATYNVENLAPSDPDSKYTALANGVVTNLRSPDIIAVEEVQDNSGATDDGTVAADQTLTKLTGAIAAAGGPSYRWREIDPVNDLDGGQPGGNIRVAFLFDPSRVSFVDSGSATVNRSTTATEVVRKKGRAALTLSPGRIDPANPVWGTSRKPLVGEFRFGGKDVFVVANHLDSKGGDESADGRYQYPYRSSEVQRAGQAAAVHSFVTTLLSVDKKAQVVVVGDLNDYQFSPALKILTTGTAAGTAKPILTDLITTLPADQQYTYVFNGVSQVLDHILVSRQVRGVKYQVVHLNAEYADQTSDHDPQVVDIAP